MNNFEEFNTFLVQNVGSKTRAIAPTITSSVAFGYENAEEAEGIFAGSVQNPLYARMGNPTNTKLESIMAKLDGGSSAIATSSGMGAMSMVLTAFLESGDTVLCIGGFFGGTYTLVNETLARFGVKGEFFDVDEMEAIEAKLASGVKALVVESVGNPNLKLPSLQQIITLCNKYNTLVIVDNTVTPLIIQALKMGADIVIYSTTKIISGHSAALGGIAVFREAKEEDKLHNDKYRAIHPILEKAKKKAFFAICKKRAMRDFGMSANAFGSFITMLGLETLALRTQRVNENVQLLAKLLNEGLTDIEVRHPSLENHEHHDRFKKEFKDGCGSLLTLDCGSKEKAFALLNNAKLLTQTANIGDNRTLALHMRSTIYRDFTPEQCKFLGITDGLIRVSVGLESPHTIAEDFIQASR